MTTRSGLRVLVSTSNWWPFHLSKAHCRKKDRHNFLYILITTLKFYHHITVSTLNTFLCDADGAAAHADSQSIHAGINQIFGLGCCDHCRKGGKVKTVKKCVQKNIYLFILLSFMLLFIKGQPHNTHSPHQQTHHFLPPLVILDTSA